MPPRSVSEAAAPGWTLDLPSAAPAAWSGAAPHALSVVRTAALSSTAAPRRAEELSTVSPGDGFLTGVYLSEQVGSSSPGLPVRTVNGDWTAGHGSTKRRE